MPWWTDTACTIGGVEAGRTVRHVSGDWVAFDRRPCGRNAGLLLRSTHAASLLSSPPISNVLIPPSPLPSISRAPVQGCRRPVFPGNNSTGPAAQAHRAAEPGPLAEHCRKHGAWHPGSEQRRRGCTSAGCHHPRHGHVWPGLGRGFTLSSTGSRAGLACKFGPPAAPSPSPCNPRLHRYHQTS